MDCYVNATRVCRTDNVGSSCVELLERVHCKDGFVKKFDVYDLLSVCFNFQPRHKDSLVTTPP